MLPPLPSWEGFHPLIVHFPVAILLVAPAAIVAAMIFDRQAKVLSLVALAMIATGTTAAFVAQQSGAVAAGIADVSDAASAVLERHAELASLTVKLFVGLSILYTVMTTVSVYLHNSLPRPVRALVQAAYLMVYLGGTLVLANAAHAGGQLVHEFGIRNTASAETPASRADAAVLPASQQRVQDRD
jgi:uncharacterized membrane protein